MEDNIQHLAGANMDIDLTTVAGQIAWQQDKCPWNAAEQSSNHCCAIKHTFICEFFCGIDYPDIVKCCYPDPNPNEEQG